MTDAAVLATQGTEDLDLGLPNKFTYPEFAGFAGEDLLHKIIDAILPLSLGRTWEIFEREHAFDNDCFLSLTKVAQTARRTQRTINRNIATFMARGLLVLRSEYKFFRNPDGTMRKKAVVVKDFSGLYALAHEYYLWQRSGDYIEPSLEYADLIKQDKHLLEKLRRFEDYRRLLYNHRPGPEARVRDEDRYFSDYQVEDDLSASGQVLHAEVSSTRQNKTSNLSKELPIDLAKASKDRFNEKAYDKNLKRDSFDSAQSLDEREAGASPNTCSQNRGRVAPGYKKGERENGGGTIPQNESETNPVTPPQIKGPARAGKTRESAEMHQDVLDAKRAMTAAAIQLERSAREEKPLPAENPLARSFIHEIAGIFGDLNEKGSKTGIERSIESFNLELPDVLLCLVRAYVVARDTKDEKIRHRRPGMGEANRMPLFCSMFKKFAQALGPGSAWQYTWEQMLDDIEADDRLGVWVSEHQAELVGGASDQTGRTGNVASASLDTAGEAEEIWQMSPAPVIPDAGWATSEDAFEWGSYLLQELVNNGYGDLTVQVSLPKRGTYYQVLVVDVAGNGYRLMGEEDVADVVAQVRTRTFSTNPEAESSQPAAAD